MQIDIYCLETFSTRSARRSPYWMLAADATFQLCQHEWYWLQIETATICILSLIIAEINNYSDIECSHGTISSFRISQGIFGEMNNRNTWAFYTFYEIYEA